MGALMPSRSQDWVDVTPIVAVCSDLFGMFLYCIVLYCIVLYCIVLYCIVLYRIVLYCIILYWFFIVLYCILWQHPLIFTTKITVFIHVHCPKSTGFVWSKYANIKTVIKYVSSIK